MPNNKITQVEVEVWTCEIMAQPFITHEIMLIPETDNYGQPIQMAPLK